MTHSCHLWVVVSDEPCHAWMTHMWYERVTSHIVHVWRDVTLVVPLVRDLTRSYHLWVVVPDEPCHVWVIQVWHVWLICDVCGGKWHSSPCDVTRHIHMGDTHNIRGARAMSVTKGGEGDECHLYYIPLIICVSPIWMCRVTSQGDECHVPPHTMSVTKGSEGDGRWVSLRGARAMSVTYTMCDMTYSYSLSLTPIERLIRTPSLSPCVREREYELHSSPPLCVTWLFHTPSFLLLSLLPLCLCVSEGRG